MSTDSTDTTEHDGFEAELAARMGAATDRVDAAGVTREGIDDRVAARRVARRRRQGGMVLAAAALVVVAGIGALAIGGSDEPDSSVFAGQGETTDAPTTEAPTTEGTTTSDPCDDTIGEGEVAPDPILPEVDGPGAAGSCVATETTTGSTTEVPTTTEPEPTTTETPTTAAPPPTTTEAPTTTSAPLTPGQPCTPGSSRDCIDPEGDGSYVYLIGGGDCMASPIAGPMCTDLDGDGHAGYPDSEVG